LISRAAKLMKLKAFLNTPRSRVHESANRTAWKFCWVLLVLYHTMQRYRQVTPVTS
jgi:hypothetical protein